MGTVRDYTSGCRGFSGTVIKKISAGFGTQFIKETGFTATLEILLKAGTVTDRISETPLVLRYEKKSGQSKMKVARTIIRYAEFFCVIRHLARHKH